MQIIEKLSDSGDRLKGCCVTIGNFDGVHLGHREIIATAKAAAQRTGRPAVAITFDPHPVVILHPEKAPAVLTPLKLKESLLAEAGIDYLLVIKDSFQLLNLSPAEFVSEFLMKTFAPKVVVEGADFNFGYGRSGNADTLKTLGEENAFDVIIVDDVEIELAGEKKRVSSTLIRHLLQAGEVAEAALAQGRPFKLIGQVVKGRGKGTHLGFPTANIEPHNQLIPAEGVYAGFVSIDEDADDLAGSGRKIPAVFSLGRVKTFVTEHPLLTEAHLFSDDVGDLYGKFLAMDFIDFVRHQRRFESEEQLKEQIEKDCTKAKDILSTKQSMERKRHGK